MRLFLVSVTVAFFLTADVFARDLGSGQETAVVDDVAITVFTYRPPDCARPALLFVFHGNSRTAKRYRNYARRLADRVCLLVFAPLFDKDRFPSWRYHRGGIVRKGRTRPEAEWTVTKVAALVTWARRREGRPDAPYYLFGHSAGGQFLSRVAAFAPPDGVGRIVIANPSSQVMPSFDEPAPYGMGNVFRKSEGLAPIRRYLGLPVTVYLGEDDTGSKDLHNHPAARRQGANRLERGKFVFRAARAIARERGWAFNWRLVTVPNVGHSMKRMLAPSRALDALGLARNGRRQ